MQRKKKKRERERKKERKKGRKKKKKTLFHPSFYNKNTTTFWHSSLFLYVAGNVYLAYSFKQSSVRFAHAWSKRTDLWASLPFFTFAFTGVCVCQKLLLFSSGALVWVAKNRLLASSCTSVCLHVSPLHELERIFVKFGIWGTFMKICRRVSSLVKVGQNFRTR